jgi:hypothetical protein
VRLFSLTIVLLIIALLGDPMSLFAQSTSTQKFDSYGQLSTDDEAARLDAFREELRTHPNLLGYLIGYSGNTVSRGAFLRRLYGDERYLVAMRGLEPDRLFTLDGGNREKRTIEMWLVPSGSARPTPSPTQRPSDITTRRYIFDDECVQCEPAVNLDLYGLSEGLKFYAAELKRMPATRGVIVIRPGSRVYTREALREAKHAKRLLVRDYNVAANQIVIKLGRCRKDGLVTAEMWIVRGRV